MTHNYKGDHRKPSLEEVCRQFKKKSYEKIFICEACGRVSKMLITSNKQKLVIRCADCADKNHTRIQKNSSEKND